MNLDDYTKELFGGLDGWFQRSGVYCKGSFQTIDRSSSIEFEQATQIAKEVQRREIAARLDEKYSNCCGAGDIYDGNLDNNEGVCADCGEHCEMTEE